MSGRRGQAEDLPQTRLLPKNILEAYLVSLTWCKKQGDPPLLKMSGFFRCCLFCQRRKPLQATPKNTPEVWLILSEKNRCSLLILNRS